MPALHPKQRGEWVELQFMARASAHGLIVSKPWGDSAHYDFIVESAGRFHRVQVKSTSFTRGGAYTCNLVRCGSGHRNRPYAPGELDFFALYIIPEDVWYIVPAATVAGKRSVLCLRPNYPRNVWFRYLEAWHLLSDPRTDDEGPRATRAPSPQRRTLSARPLNLTETAAPQWRKLIDPPVQSHRDASPQARTLIDPPVQSHRHPIPAGAEVDSPARECREAAPTIN